MKRGAALIALMSVALSACGPRQSPTAKNGETATAPLNPCEAKLGSANSGKRELIFPPIQERLPWNSSEDRVTTIAKSIASRMDRSDLGLSAYINGNDDWVQFQFTAGKLSQVRERHNNGSRQPPFVDGYLARAKALFGNTASVSVDGDGACNARWQRNGMTVRTVWRDSEWFVDIYYEPKAGVPTLPAKTEAAIWAFYTPLEDRQGQDAALAATAKKFGLSRDDVFQVIVRGLEQGRPLPEIEEPKSAPVRGPAPRAAGRESVPSEDRRSYDELKLRGFSDADAAKAASAVRRLCEAGHGNDCR